MDMEFRPVSSDFDPAIRLAPSGDRYATVHVAPLHCRYSSVADVYKSLGTDETT